MIKDKKVIIIFLFLLIAYPSIKLLQINLKPESAKKRNLERIHYTLDNSNDIVYDPFLLFNIFYENDVDFYWMINGGLETNYIANFYWYIKIKKPKLISTYGTRLDTPYSLLKKYYTKSSVYSDLYFIKYKYLINLIAIRYWLKTHRPSAKVLLNEIDPYSLDFDTVRQVGNQLYINQDYKNAAYWLKAAVLKKPIDKNSLKKLVKIYRNRDKKEYEKWLNAYNKLKQTFVATYVFEKGNTFEGILIKKKTSQKRETISLSIYLDPLNPFDININHTAFISFEKDGNFYFGKDFSLNEIRPLGEIYEIKGSIPIPPNIPAGQYNVYFTFRIPKSDYRYHLIKYEKHEKLLPSQKVLVGKVLL